MKFSSAYFDNEVKDGFYVPSLMKKCWAAQLEVLSDIDRLCRKHNIEYFAEWGTLLGAVRHGGFIPWDDDMDICMKREDYDKFLDVALVELKDRYIIECFRNTDTRNNFLTRISNINQFRFDEEFLEKFNEFPYPAGLDVFPIDFLPSEDKQEEFRTVINSLILIAESENRPEVGKEDLEDAIRQIESTYNLKIDRSRPIMSQVYVVAERVGGSVPEEESEYLTLMPVWLDKTNYKIPKELYSKSIRIPYENTTIPVPIGYDEILKIKFKNYMKPVRDWSSHDYPYFTEHEQVLKNKYDIEFGKYNYSPMDLERMLPESLPAQLLGFLPIVKEAHEELKLRSSAEVVNEDTTMTLLQDCQDAAIEIGNLIESILGEGTKTVGLLEEYCELVFACGEDFSTENLLALDKKLMEIVDSVREDIPKNAGTSLSTLEEVVQKRLKERERPLVIFMVTKESEWKYVADQYNKYRQDRDADVYVMPIPYYTKSILGKITDEQYEYDKFDPKLPLIKHEQFDLQTAHPDKIIIQNPFDDTDFAHTIAPAYYSSRIKNYTDELIYIPPFVTDEFIEGDSRCVKFMRHYVTVPGVVNADKIFVQSSNIRDRYIARLVEMAGEDSRSIWEEKVSVYEFAENIMKDITKDEVSYPQAWAPIIKDETGKYKKIMLCVISAGAVYSHIDKIFDKIDNTLSVFAENKEKLTLILNVDANVYDAIDSSDKANRDKIREYIKSAKESDWYIYCDEDDLDKAILIADGFYGDGCIPAIRCRELGKPVMLQDYNVM